MYKQNDKIKEELDKIYPILFVTNTPINDFLAAADETIRSRDRLVVQMDLFNYIKTIRLQDLQAIKEMVEDMKTEEGHSLQESLAYNQALEDIKVKLDELIQNG